MSTKKSEDDHPVSVDKNKEEEYDSDDSSKSSRKCQIKSDIWEGFSILKQNGDCVNSGKRCTFLLEPLDSSGKSKTGPDLDGARRALVMTIITTGQSLSLVEGSRFQHFVRTVNPLIPLSRSSLDQDVMDLYGRERNTLSALISEASGGLSFAVDKWRCKANGDNYNDDIYLCVSACFIDSDWKLQRRVVGFKHMELPDDALYVAETIALCFSELKVDKKIISITLDNGTLDNEFYEASMADKLKTVLHDKAKLLCGGELCQVHCCTDIVNSVVTGGLELIAETIDKIREGICYITYNANREDAFYRIAEDFCLLDATMNLRADLSVTWDSTYKMLGCALYYRDALTHFASTDKTFLSEFHLSDDEWNKVATMENFLKPIYDITFILINTKYKTANLYFLGVYKVYRLLELTKEVDNFMAAMVKDTKVKFDKYWSECSQILACAAVLDPRCKLSLISDCFRELYGEADASQHLDRVIAFLHSLFTEYEKSSFLFGSNVVECHAKDGLSEDYSPQEQRTELDRYLELPALDLNTNLDILEFWSGMSKCYPDLANMARDILAVPISTAASKSAFNTRGKVLNRRRASLRSDLLEMLISLHDWTCPKDRYGIAVSAIEEYYSDDEDEEEDEEFADELLEESIFESDDYDEESMEESEGDEDNGNVWF